MGGVSGGMGLRRGLLVHWGGMLRGREELVKNDFLGIFWKINTYLPPLDECVRSSFAESCKNKSQFSQKVISFQRFYVQKKSIILKRKMDYN